MDYALSCGCFRRRRANLKGPLTYEDVYKPNYIPDVDKVRVEMNAMREFGPNRVTLDTNNDEIPGYVQNMALAKLKEGPRKAYQRSSNIE